VLLLPKYLSNRIALFSAAAAFFASSAVLLSLRPIAIESIEDHLRRESTALVESFAEFSMGYFYWQDNLLHMQTQQRFLNSFPNLLYSYIVTEKDGIILGIDGINSPELGQSEQTWEPRSRNFGRKRNEQFKVNKVLTTQFPERLTIGQDLILLSIPMSCEAELGGQCGELRVALSPVTHISLVNRFSIAILITLIFISLLVGLCVLVVSRTFIAPVSLLTLDLLKLAQNKEKTDLGNGQLESKASDSKEVQRLKASISKFSEHIIESSTARAIAQVTAMVAHDVRRPFSMLSVILDSISEQNDPDAIREVVSQTAPEVKRAIASVSSMVEDVMQIGAETKITAQPHRLTPLLVDSIAAICRIYHSSEVNFEYSLLHKKMLKIDSEKMLRVFTNLITNAFQAMSLKGTMTFRSYELRGRTVLEIENSNSYIAPEKMPKIFDLFFTADKTGGTGLGLAIVKKYIDAHQAKIECRSEKNESHPSGYVCFTLTFNNFDQSEDQTEGHTPSPSRSSREINDAHTQKQQITQTNGYSLSPSHEDDIRFIHSVLENDVFTILIVDDEGIYRQGIWDIVHKNGLESVRINLLEASSAHDAARHIQSSKVDLIIQDIDLGEGLPDGFECIKNLRQLGYAGHVCIHSNRFFFDGESTALQGRADAILPKPMNNLQLTKVVRAILEKRNSGNIRDESSAHSSKESALQADRDRDDTLTVWVIDDSSIFRMAWQRALKKDCRVKTFSCTAQLRQHFDAHGSDSDEPDIVFTDWALDPTNETGKDVIDVLHEYGYSGPIFLWSNASEVPASIQEHIQGALSKEIPTLAALHRMKRPN
jgi:signal transduction histidine kinase/DNA-binding NarL/FixJ family response regulator